MELICSRNIKIPEKRIYKPALAILLITSPEMTHRFTICHLAHRFENSKSTDTYFASKSASDIASYSQPSATCLGRGRDSVIANLQYTYGLFTMGRNIFSKIDFLQ